MASEASRKKAKELCYFEHDSRHDDKCGNCALIAAALDEARAEGRAEALGDAIPLKDLMAEALEAARAEGRAEGERIGAERERWECHQAVTETNLPDTYSEPALEELAARIAARGPMLSPVEEP